MQWNPLKRQIGLSFSDSTVRAVLVEKRAQQFHSYPLTTASMTAVRHEFPLFLKSLVPLCPKPLPPLSLGIDTTHTLLQEITLDSALLEHDIHDYVEQSLAPLFSHEPSQLYFDWELCHHDPQQSHVSFRVLAVLRTQLNPFIQACKKLSLKLTAIETNLHACARFVQHEYAPTAAVGVLRANAQHVELGILQGSHLIFFKNKPYSTNALCELLQNVETQYPHYQIEKLFSCADAFHAEILEKIEIPVTALEAESVSYGLGLRGLF